MRANYSPLILAVLSQAWMIFGRFTPDNQEEVARWVQKNVRDIRDGYEEKQHRPATTPWKTF